MTAGGRIEVRLARTCAEVEAAQRLRYRVFYEECGAHAGPRMRESRRDVDAYDATMDHLVVIDHARSDADGQVVGNYRLLRGERLGSGGSFYSSSEFDISPMLDSGKRLLELGRSCVLREYRELSILQLLWRAIAGYVADHDIQVMFGCASLKNNDPAALREQLSYLHRHHLAPPSMRPRALVSSPIRIESQGAGLMDPARARAMLGPLIKGYLRLGAGIGEGAYVDHQFNTVDVCIVMPTGQLTRRYRRHYERAIERPLPGADTADLVDEDVDPRMVASR